MNWQEILISTLSTVGAALLAWLSAVVTKWINSKIKDADTKAMLTSVSELVLTSVKTIYQTYVESLKASGTFDATAQEEAKNRATLLIKSSLTSEQTAYIEKTYGSVDTYVSKEIETSIYNLKK